MIRMEAKLAVFALGLSLAATAALADPQAIPAPPSGPSPRIKFDETNVNLGEVVRGKDAVATFTYRNTGEVPLHIVSVKPG